MTEFDQAYIRRGTLRQPTPEPQDSIWWHAVGTVIGLVTLAVAVGYVVIGAMK